METDENDVLFQIFSENNITMIHEILTMSKEAIDSLTYEKEGVSVSPPAHVLAKLHILKAWNAHLLEAHGLKVVDWNDNLLVNTDQFDEFRLSIYNPDVLPTPPVRPARKPASVDVRNKIKPQNLAQEFRKGIKRDKGHYNVLRDEKQWDEWKRQTIATIYAHGCENITSSGYSPTDPEEILLFREQNKYMFDVFTSILQTPMGKYIVRSHEETRDAQKVWSDYIKHMRTSTRADMEIEDLMTQLTSTRLSTSYTGTTQNFLIEWLDKMRKYEELTPRNSHFPETMKKAMLQNAVADFASFRNVKMTEQMEIAKGGGPIPYLQYIGLLQSVAAIHDRNASPAMKVKRITNTHDIYGPDDEYYLVSPDLDMHPNTDDEFFGSYQVNSIEANQQQQRFRPSLRKETWLKMSRADQLVWDQMSPHGKWAIISESRNLNKTKPASRDGTVNSTTSLSNKHPKSTSVNLLDSKNSVTSESDYNIVNSSDLDDGAKVGSVDSTNIIANVLESYASNDQLSQSDIRHILSSSKNAPQSNVTPPSSNVMNRYQANRLEYRVCNRKVDKNRGALVDRGANGGIAGSDVRIISKTDRKVDVSGIDDHEMNNLPVVSAGGVVNTQRGPVLAIFHQYAYVPSGKTIHSCIQMESYGVKVDEKSIKLNQGSQTITTIEGYIIPLDIIHGLAYMQMRPYSDREWDELPHIVFTSDKDWDPDEVDMSLENDKSWYDSQPDIKNANDYDFTVFDQRGNYVVPKSINSHLFQENLELCINERVIKPSSRDYSKYTKYFLDTTPDIVKHTFRATTQYARSGWITGAITQTHKSPFPALNVFRRNEAVATDTIYCDTPAVDNGSTCAQFYVGVDTKFCSAYGVLTDGEFINTLLDVIRNHGAMHTLITDGAKAELSKRVQDVLRHMIIKQRQTEPHYQHQNPAERRYKTVKAKVNAVLNATGAPASYWLLCLEYVIFILNRTAMHSLQWKTPFEKLYGVTPDISAIYRFRFYDRVYFARDESRGGKAFPSLSNEVAGRFAGFATNVGHSLTYKIVTEATHKIVYRSRIKLASIHPNLRIDRDVNDSDDPSTNADDSVLHDADDFLPQPVVKGSNESDDDTMTSFDPSDVIGKTYLTEPSEDGLRQRLKIIEQLDHFDQQLNQNPAVVKFRAVNGDKSLEEIITYNQILDKIETDDGDDGEWKFTAIVAHEGPLSQNHHNYKGSKWNVKVKWNNGEVTWEPLSLIRKSDPVTCAIYAKENALLDEPGWTRFRKLANKQSRMIRSVNKAKLKMIHSKPAYKFGVQVPRSHDEAMQLDQQNGNNLWAQAEAKELQQIDSYNTFKDVGFGNFPHDHKRIKVHMVYDVKPDLRRKARLVADGHLTGTPIDSVYSSVVSIKGLKYVLFIGELNNLECWSTDVGNAYLEAFTQEKIYIIAGPEFGARQGRTLIVSKALYGLKSSGLRWWERFSEILIAIGFQPSKAEDDIWMRDMGTHYEYLARYVDDLAIVSKHPEKIIKTLEVDHNLKLKGSGKMKYHLGANFERDDDGTLCMSPSKYIERMVDNYHRMFGVNPKATYTSPLERGDHPELDDSEELGDNDIKKYQSLIGALQWVVTLGRFDIAVAVMTMASFRSAPRIGHLNRVKRIYGYLLKMKHAALRFRVNQPDLSAIPIDTYSWEKSIYGDVNEMIPEDAPKAYGPPVTMVTYVDANLFHDVTTGRAVTGVLHLLNGTIVHYYTKKQPVVETATYGSEFMAARIATEQIIEARIQLRYLGMKLDGPAYLFGDNKTVVESSNAPKARLHKRHVMLSFHRVREAIAANILKFIFINGKVNPADVLTKLWGYQQVRVLLKAMLFWHGDTMDVN